VPARVLLFVALLSSFSYFNHNDGWTQGVRLAELHAVVLKHTLRIDDYISYTGDRALIDGHYYSEKAPAMALLALPAFAITAWIEQRAGVDPDGQPGQRIAEWVTTAGSIGLLAALGGVAFFSLIKARADALTAVLATFSLFLGSLTFPYATSLFAHAGTIALLSIALWGVMGGAPGLVSARRDVIAGVAAGLAVASEYPAILPGAAIGLYLASVDLKRMLRYGIATLPAAALILLNNYAISGSPFKFSYGSNPLFPEITAVNTYGFNMPDPAAMRAVLIGEYRGLFFWSPVMLMAIPGIYYLFRAERAVAIMTVAACLMILLQVGAFYTWFGGNAIGPRYLSPALPFFGLAAAYGIKRFPEMGLILTVVSVALMLMVVAIAIDPPGDVLTPFQSFYVPRIEQHRFADNLGTLIGLPLWASLIAPILLPVIAAWQLLKEPHGAA
jgi:hypothetical protein